MSDITAFLSRIGTDNNWIFQVFIIVLLTVALNTLSKRFLARLSRKLDQTQTPWDNAIVDAARKPLTLLVWLLGISYAIDIIRASTNAPIFAAVSQLRDVGVIIIFSLFLLNLLRLAEQIFISRSKGSEQRYDRTTVEAIVRLLRISVIITCVLVTLQTLGFSVSGVLAFGGIGGIAIGFAAKDLLANFFGAIMIYLDRPFAIGDWIRSNDREIEGTVENIGWRLTRIRTFDKRPLYVPNSAFASIAVENPSRMQNRRIYETIGIRYADAASVATIVSEVKQMLQQHPEIDQTQTMIVNFNQFAPSSLDFFIYTFTRTTDWIYYHEIKQDVLLKILAIIEQHDAEIAFPTSTIHLSDDALNLPGNK